ncbi:MAG: CHASE2 domain-containing protein [Cyanothece sp. SIO2G6]|nr:CHASE2 domain-containing protein [Cyanothece sp. SIO2G6]
MFQPGTRLHNDQYLILQPLGQGGFSQTFEVDDDGTVKVLKVLQEHYHVAVKLFQREFKVLSQLNHPGIPQVDADGYFMIPSTDPSQPTHCLVMERVPGMDLRQWLHKNQGKRLEEDLALDWLRQLAEILTQLHQHHCFHRDIKPSNIMLRPDGQLVLIDFGAVREVTETFLEKQADDITRTHLYSRGYTPMEQMHGKAVPESDFFALGRTFVHLLTGANPLDFSTDPETGKLLWQTSVPHISVALADLIDQLMAPFPAKRPRSPQAIASMIETVRSQLAQPPIQRVGDRHTPLPSPQYATKLPSHTILDVVTRPPDDKYDIDQSNALDVIHHGNDRPQDTLAWKPRLDEKLSVADPGEVLPGGQRPVKSSQPRWHHRWRSWSQAAVCSVVVTVGVTGLRWLGLLQSLELQAFDQLMRWRSPEPPDNRIVLVTIDSNDITYQNAQGWVRQGSLADEALAQLLDTLQRYDPRLIGLDIYRPSSDLGITPSQDVSFREALGRYDNLIAVCAVGGGDQNHPAIDPPQEVPPERVGFSNIPYDADGRVRRQLVGMTPDATCNTSQSLSSQLALRYLLQDNITVGLEDGMLTIGDRLLPPINQRVGGYQHPDIINDGGYQLLLNYRSRPLLSTQIPLAQILDAEPDHNLAQLIADRVVIIGTIDRSYGDYHLTPYGALPGVVIQGHMVSQMLSTILDDRPLLWGLPHWADSVWILGWTGFAGVLAIVGRSPWHYGGGLLLLFISLTGLSFVLLLQGGWVPLVPAAISILLTTSTMIWRNHRTPKSGPTI